MVSIRRSLTVLKHAAMPSPAQRSIVPWLKTWAAGSPRQLTAMPRTTPFYNQWQPACQHDARKRKAWKLEKWWQGNVVGTEDIQPDPKETYQETLAKVNGTPAAEYTKKGSLNTTSVVDDSFWKPAYTTARGFISREKQQVNFEYVSFRLT
jgi:hypothetical protein